MSKAVVFIENGRVSNVLMDDEFTEVICVDYDTEGSDTMNVVNVEGRDANIYYPDGEIAADAVYEIADIID